MKWFCLICIFLVNSLFVHGQNKDQKNDTTIYTGYKLKTDTIDRFQFQTDGALPTFDAGFVYPAGIKDYIEFNHYLEKSIKYPSGSSKSFETYKIFVSFVIEKDGSVSHVKVERPSLDNNLNQQALTVIKNLPRWKAPIYNGKSVRLSFTAPIVVKIAN